MMLKRKSHILSFHLVPVLAVLTCGCGQCWAQQVYGFVCTYRTLANNREVAQKLFSAESVGQALEMANLPLGVSMETAVDSNGEVHYSFASKYRAGSDRALSVTCSSGTTVQDDRVLKPFFCKDAAVERWIMATTLERAQQLVGGMKCFDAPATPAEKENLR